MDKIKKISYDELKEIIASKGFDTDIMLKDYYITAILYLIKDVKGIYFKGGTALHKIFLNYKRLSEDIDFTITRDIRQVKKEVTEKINKSELFTKVTKDKDVEDFTRLIIHYKDFSGKDNYVFIDLNKRAELLLKPAKHDIKHFYNQYIPEFTFNTLAKEELIAEKITAAIGRNKPRDYYDIYAIIKAKIPINLKLVREKCKSAGIEFNITKMFNKAKKLKNRWDEDIIPLLSKDISFREVIHKLAEYFKLKEEKAKRKGISPYIPAP